MRRAMFAAGLSLALILSACGGDDDGGAPGTSSSSRRSSTSTSTTTTTAPCHFVGTLQPQENALVAVEQLLSDVTTGTDGCVDTVTFTFRPNPAEPSYRIEYAEGPFQNSAGETMTPAGTVFLRVRFQPAWIADLSVESAPATYTGPRVITPTGLKSVRGLALFDASEAVVGWAIGLDEQRPYTVEASSAKVVVTIG